MASPNCERAISDAKTFGNALLKFISPNNVGATGGHECGFLLPKPIWKMYSPHAPKHGRLDKHWVSILWQDGRQTDSCITWYGRGTRSEYRLTRFGREFPWMNAGCVGDLLVLIRTDERDFLGYVLDEDEDIEEIQAALGVEILKTWGVYNIGDPEQPVDENTCLEERFRELANSTRSFPNTSTMSLQAREATIACIRNFTGFSLDRQLLRLIKDEYSLFRTIERKLCQNDINRLFKSIDDFIATAATIMNRRKSRAGRSLENHIEYLLGESNIPYDARPRVDGNPDFLIPGKTQYMDGEYPVGKLFMLGVKRTCKERWRQVLNEAPRVTRKHLLTTQHAISIGQLKAMKAAGVVLVVPKRLQRNYPKDSGIHILSLEEFVSDVSRALR